MAGLLLVAALGLGSGWLALEGSRQQRTAAQLDEALAAIEPEAIQLEARTRAVELVRAVQKDRRQLGAAVAELFRATPPAVRLEALTFERQRSETTIRGGADSTQQVLEYIRQLERLEGVAGVSLKYTTRRSAPGGERTDFELTVRHGRKSS